jgi:hypothetical protein
MERTPSSADFLIQNQMRPVIELLQGGNPQEICARYSITRAELEKRIEAYQTSPRHAALLDHLSTRRVGRNEPCPCGSGKKYKKCCLPQHEEARKNLPPDQVREMEERKRAGEKLDEAVRNGFELLFAQDFGKARQLSERLIETYPEDDRLHEILITTFLATGDYDSAFHACRRRWQVAQEEKEFYQENDYHKREGVDRKEHVNFFSPTTWLEKLWVANRARAYRDMFPVIDGSPTAKLVEKLRIANDIERFPGRQEGGFELRQKALAPVLSELKAQGPSAIPYLLPLTYSFSWASLFVPDLLEAYGSDESARLLAELSMFRFPYFSQNCLTSLEKFGERAVDQIERVLAENPAFDELKVGVVAVLGSIRTRESFDLLAKLTEHENPYLVSCAAQSLERHESPEAIPFLEKAKDRLKAMSKIAGAIRDLAGPEGE